MSAWQKMCFRVCLLGTVHLIGNVASATVSWVVETSIEDIHVLDRLTTLGAETLHNCAVECYSRPTCICMGFSSTNKQCQLYDMNIGVFGTGFIQQSSTILYRAACSNIDYTYIRHFDFCLKFHRDLRNYTEATDICISEGSNIAGVSENMLLYMNKLYPNLESYLMSKYFVKGVMYNSTHVSKGTQLLGVESFSWAENEPTFGKDCLTIGWDDATQTVRFYTHDCSDTLYFFCGHSG